MISEKWPFERRRAAKSHIFFISCSFWVVRAQKNKLPILINAHLHIVIGVDHLSACANCISNPLTSFAQPKVELEGLN